MVLNMGFFFICEMTLLKLNSVGRQNKKAAGFVIKLVVTAELLREKQVTG